ncbi:Emp24/gp25L/p24 family protein [Ancylostoma duodenale]|uniref:Emp24/gp25L/p24 family protein n=1 Tax=Ancylostoma duodenale TaxID=51022 RepID=A0A0C2BEY2_9BILA|nr:Emp24/gp25L/p24 family protein [Ancylostoma duodenale]
MSLLQADWKWALAQYVNLDGWPIHWGGNRSENGDPKCPATIKYGMGPVPSDYFVDPKTAMPDYDQLTTVYAGDKHLISIRIKEKSRICWQYMTDDDDIGFAIHFDPSFQANNLTEMEVVFPYIRLECTNVPISGHYVAEKAGNYIIEFDNYYSWFSAKQLRYNIEIEEL